MVKPVARQQPEYYYEYHLQLGLHSVSKVDVRQYSQMSCGHASEQTSCMLEVRTFLSKYHNTKLTYGVYKDRGSYERENFSVEVNDTNALIDCHVLFLKLFYVPCSVAMATISC